MPSPLNCTVTNKTIDADPDIVGNGVLAAFFATATFTAIAVIVGYFSHSLDEAVLTDLDEQIITWVHGRWKKLKRLTQAIPALNRAARTDAVSQFILSLSDQQLITGLSILVAGVSNQKTLTGYEFSIILSLAWFSSTTHLATLDALRKFLSSQGVLRNLRVAGMLCVSILLIYTLAIVFLLQNQTLPVQCLFSTAHIQSAQSTTSPGNSIVPINITSTVNTTGFTIPTAPRNTTFLDNFEDSVESLSGLSSIVILSLRIIWGYSTRIHGLYFEIPLLERIFSFKWNREAVGLRMAKIRTEKLLRIRDTNSWLRYILEAWYEYERSFIATIPGITYNFTFGICLVASYRWLGLPLTSDDSVMNFGQITPLLLLFLPFLTAGQTIHEYRSKGAETLRRSISTKSRHSHTNSTETRKDRSEPVRRDPLIYLSQGIGGIDQDMVVAGEEYDHHLADILKYYLERARKIAGLEINENSKEDDLLNILQLKREILQEYKSIKTVEVGLHVSPPLTLFAVEIALAIASRVIFNIGPSSVLADTAVRFSISALNIGVIVIGPLTERLCDMLIVRRRRKKNRRDFLGEIESSRSRIGLSEGASASLHLPVNMRTGNQVSDGPRSRPITPLPSYNEEMGASLPSPAYHQHS